MLPPPWMLSAIIACVNSVSGSALKVLVQDLAGSHHMIRYSCLLVMIRYDDCTCIDSQVPMND